MEVKKLLIFLSFCYYNFENTVTYFDKDMFKKNLSMVQTITAKWKPHLEVSLFVLNYQTVFYLCLLFYF